MPLNEKKRKENLVDLPSNVKLTALGLSSLVKLAISKEYLNKDSVLYALLSDIVTSLIKAELRKRFINLLTKYKTTWQRENWGKLG